MQPPIWDCMHAGSLSSRLNYKQLQLTDSGCVESTHACMEIEYWNVKTMHAWNEVLVYSYSYS